jgi:hypothetical protein
MKKLLPFCFLITFLLTNPLLAQVGKINGFVRDAATNEALIGANIILEGTTLGAASNIDGYYVIVNVPPGTYTLKASMVGYASQSIREIRVNIDLTTEINVDLSSSTLETTEVVVVAKQPVVRQDVSSSVVNLNIKEIENLPVVSVSRVIGLQAGVQGLTIRGGGSDQTAFVVNGITLRDERDNTPYTGISFTSIEELQIQTGGFNAEYGNIRSGLINVVTKEGKKDKYTFSFIGRYRPAGRKHFGDAINSPNSYWIKPYIDDAVAWTGTKNGAWDIYEQAQYQEFRGWNKVSEELFSDDNPNNNLSPEAAQRLFLWQHRKQTDIIESDFDVDMSLAGPVPVISEELGNLRFSASYRQTREMYYLPLSDDAYRDYNLQAKLTSDIADGMKLSFDWLYGQQTGTGSSRAGGPGIFRSPSGIASVIDSRSGASYLDARVYATDYWAPSRVFNRMYGFKFTHVISPQTFYEVVGSRVSFNYLTAPGRPRYFNVMLPDSSIISATDSLKGTYVGGIFFDEAPFGVYSGTSAGIGSSMNMGLGFSNSRDTSKLVTYTLKFDYASQIDKYNYFKTGFEFIYTDNNVNYALIEPSLPTNNSRSTWRTFPIRTALYVQDKLEFEGMIANIGLRLDYLDPGGQWYVYDPFNKALSGALSEGIDTLLVKQDVEKQIDISPRLGVAFPISINSKLYFNYGHFRSIPAPEQLFLLRRNLNSKEITRLANPNNPLPKTVAYELGYEQNLWDQFLLSIKGYYKDVTDQTRLVQYVSRDNSVNYFVPEPNNYEDIRGFEFELRKNRGDWVTGFINYTYMVSTYGYFGLSRYDQNPALQRENERETNAFKQEKPIPTPYARANIDLFTPLEWGPKLGGINILEDFRINLLAVWSSGTYFSWTGPGGVKPGFEYNIQWKDFYNVDMRLSKSFRFGPVDLEFFMDIFNVFNIKYMSYRAGFIDGKDYDNYMKSLHLPDDIVGKFNYGNIPGEDVPGEFRDEGVDYQPMVYTKELSLIENPNTRAYYYDASTGKYYQWNNTDWSQVSDSRIEEVLDTKAYIDMPNLPYTAFLNPRDVYFGIKLNIDLQNF